MFLNKLAAIRDLSRLHDIAAILIRYGYGDIVARLGLTSLLERAGLEHSATLEYAHLASPVRARRALEEMGPTFIKLGQLLSTRVDLFEADWITEFSKLQDSAPALPYSQIEQQLTEDLGAPPEHLFLSFETQPLAAASIAQVYRARLKDNSDVIVKIRRPGIKSIIEADLRWLMRLAELAEQEYPDTLSFQPRDVVRQLSRSLKRELDFTIECRNADRIAHNFAYYHDVTLPEDTKITPDIVIPRVYWQWTRERVCVQEYIDGIPGRQLAAVDKAGLDRKKLARLGAHAVLKMIVEDGLFHADPHPGNIFYLPQNRIAFIDFGMVGHLTEVRREQLIQLLLGLVQHEPLRVMDILLDWTGNSAKDETELNQEIASFLDQYHGMPLKQLRLGEILADMAALLRQHQLRLPSDLILLIKAFISLEGMGRELDPDFNMAGEAMPMLETALRARYKPAAVIKRGIKSINEAISLISGLPHDLSTLLRAARRGRLEIHIEITHLKHLGNQLDGAANRMVIGIVVAALIVGSSIVMTVPGGPSLFGLPFFGLCGFLIAAAGGLWVLMSVWKSNRADRD